jgi:hypothetical protein
MESKSFMELLFSRNYKKNEAYKMKIAARMKMIIMAMYCHTSTKYGR